MPSPGTYWIAYYSDWSGFAVFNSELRCLRHAVTNHMEVAVVPFNVDDVRGWIREHLDA